MKTKITYYKGDLKCQFSTLDSKKVGNTLYQQSLIDLQPRFRMYNLVEIGENEVPDELFLKDKPYVKCNKKCDVEIYYSEETILEKQTTIKRFEQIILILEKDNNGGVDLNQKREGGKRPFDEYLGKTEDENDFYSSFDAIYGKHSHGKIKGLAYCKEVEYIEEVLIPSDDIIIEEQKGNKIKKLGKLANTAGCFSFFYGNRRAQSAGSKTVDTSSSGCFSNPIVQKMYGINGASDKGCFGTSPSGGGCFSAGCSLPLSLLFLAGLFYWFLSQNSCQKTIPAPVIIHDTIRVEVIKERIDTLMIVKTDTLSYIDSTTKVNYETVSLPNVQFYTNSDTLLPTSASDLQKLAEYLSKNDSLNATIIGHTDNAGLPASNLLLSQRRAESVKHFLVSLGIKDTRLEAIGKGDKEPRAENETEVGRLMNRRVEVKLTKTAFESTKRSKKSK